MEIIDNSLCMSIKNKYSKLQCNHLKKFGDYCGVHSKCKNITRIDDIINNSTLTENSENNKFNLNQGLNVKTISTEDSSNKSDSEYNEDKINFETINENMKINEIRKFIKDNNLNISTRFSKNELLKKINEYKSSNCDYYSKINFIIIIQKYYRKYLIVRRYNCINTTDILTMQSKYNISEKYYIELTCENIKYCFDLRTLDQIIKENDNNDENIKNPYTLQPFSDNNLNYIKLRLNQIDNKFLEMKKIKLTEEQSIRQQCIDIFQKFNNLDNYTDYRWFLKLSIHELKILWKKAEDVWNYRCEIPYESKKKILKNINAFIYTYKLIDNINNKYKLQNIILSEFNRFVSEGTSNEDKKIGAMLMLTALVEVSPEAAEAMPHYIQVS